MPGGDSTGVRFRACLTLALGLCAFPVTAQHPIGPEVRASRPSDEAKFNPRLLFGPGGTLLVAWGGSRITPCGEGCFGFDQLRWVLYSPAGAAQAEGLFESPTLYYNVIPILTPVGREEFSLLWADRVPAASNRLALYEQRVRWATGESRGPILLDQPLPLDYFIPISASRLSTGELAAVGVGPDEPGETCGECYGVFTFLGDSDDRPLGPLRQANAEVAGKQLPTGTAADGQGRYLVTWWSETGGPGGPEKTMVRQFSNRGEPLTPEIQANTFTEGNQYPGGAAADAGGDFVVVWNSDNQDGSFGGIYGQRFSPAAEKVGPEFRVNTVTVSDQHGARVAMDRAGNFAVVWQSFDAGRRDFWDIKGQLFRKDGSRAGAEFFVNTHRPLEQESPYVAFADNGTFGVVWTSNAQDGAEFHEIYFQRFSASPGDEPCWVRGGQVFCDTGRTGNEAEVEMTFGGRPEETLLTGDFDGDGRADLCARYGTRFRCDLDHRGAPAEAKVDFGLPADLPLMGDLDGDGRADACVRRRRQLLCDTRHDGGKPESRILFGLSSDLGLLGDLDGDHRDDPCVWRPGRFLCDLAHDGSGAELAIAFGLPGDQPALGDLDGDGRDDPCVLRAGHLLCDTAHDGGAAEADLTLGAQPGDRPLIANFDAL